jgi:hypothetical protein
MSRTVNLKLNQERKEYTMLMLMMMMTLLAGKPTKCSDAEDVVKYFEQMANECERDREASCLQAYAELKDAECRKELACTPSTKDPKECNSAIPRG